MGCLTIVFALLGHMSGLFGAALIGGFIGYGVSAGALPLTYFETAYWMVGFALLVQLVREGLAQRDSDNKAAILSGQIAALHEEVAALREELSELSAPGEDSAEDDDDD